MLGQQIYREDMREKYPWLYEEDQKMVVGTDIDALLSASYLHHHLGWEIIGFYNLEELYYKDGERENLERAIWVDLDIADPQIRSIGHHIVSFRPNDSLDGFTNSFNPNLERGIYGEGYRFTRKCPIGTISILHWLHQPTVDVNLRQASLCWLADSSWINGQSHKYRENVGTWVNEVFDVEYMQDTFDTIDTESFEHVMKGTIEDVTTDTGFAGVGGQSNSRHLEIGGGQCTFKNPRRRREDIQTVLCTVGEIMEWDTPDVPEEYETVSGNRTSRLSYDREVLKEYDGIDEWIDDTEPFSFAVPYGGYINYTTSIDV